MIMEGRMVMNSIYTAYYDLVAMAGILNIKNNNKFSAVHVYPLFRDLCLMVYQINKDILNESIDLDPNIEKIRHRVHLHGNKNNFKVFKRIIDLHTYQFGNDIDNLGFYLDGDQLVGSTIYSSYIFQDTQFFSTDPKETRNNAFAFSKMMGETIGVVVEKLIEKSNYTLPPIEIPSFLFLDNKTYRDKDILNTNFYGEEQNQNVVLTRLVISLQEASTCVWLYKGIFNNSTTGLQIENYILLRLLTIKTDEVMDNLKNMRIFLTDTFDGIDKECEFGLSGILHDFVDSELEKECRKLRNMVHYNEEKDNFLDYVYNEVKKDENYIKILVNKIVNDYMDPLNSIVSNYMQISNINSMNGFEKVTRRILSLVKRRDFRSS